MGKPHLLLVDDSEAVTAYEMGALGVHYRYSIARSGVAALESVRREIPDAMLLDLSMPEMDGDEVLRRLKADPAHASIPVVIVSTERERGEACVRAGAAAFLEKPLRAETLLSTVGELIERLRRERRAKHQGVLPVSIGPRTFALRLDEVRLVSNAVMPIALARRVGPFSEAVAVKGRVVAVLDVLRTFGVGWSAPLPDRKLAVIEHADVALAVLVDQMFDPEELPDERLQTARALLGAELGERRDATDSCFVQGQWVPLLSVKKLATASAAAAVRNVFEGARES